MNCWLEEAQGRLACFQAKGLRFALWEIRGSLKKNGSQSQLHFDGGCRWEFSPQRVRVVVGSGPSALGKSGAIGSRTEWEKVLSDLHSSMASSLESVERQLERHRFWGAHLRRGGPRPRFEVHVRWRAWCQEGHLPEVGQDRGFWVSLPGREVEWGAAASEEFPWVAEPEWELDHPGLAAAASGIGGGGVGAVSETGPVVLLPPAAGWWVHEIGHFALESRAAEEWPREWGTVWDDPNRGIWPAGFSRDDEGRIAVSRALTGKERSTDPAGLALRRRGSVREAAVPSLTGTWWEPPAEVFLDPAGVAGVPIASCVDAGRFDPATGQIWLLVGGPGSSAPLLGGALPSGTLIVAEAGRTTPRAVGARGRRPDFRRALCSRQGSVFAVMVGAPTLVLDPVRIILPDSAPGAPVLEGGGLTRGALDKVERDGDSQENRSLDLNAQG